MTDATDINVGNKRGEIVIIWDGAEILSLALWLAVVLVGACVMGIGYLRELRKKSRKNDTK